MDETKLSPMTPTEKAHGHRLPASLRGPDEIETPTAPEWAVPEDRGPAYCRCRTAGFCHHTLEEDEK